MTLLTAGYCVFHYSTINDKKRVNTLQEHFGAGQHELKSGLSDKTSPAAYYTALITTPALNYTPTTLINSLRCCNPCSNGDKGLRVCLKITFSVNLDPTTVEEARLATQG